MTTEILQPTTPQLDVSTPRLPGSLIGQRGRLQQRITESEELFRNLPAPEEVLTQAPSVAGARDRVQDRSILESLIAYLPITPTSPGAPAPTAFIDPFELQAQGEEIERQLGEYERLRSQIEWDSLLLGALEALPATLQAFPSLGADEWLSNVYPDRNIPDNVRQTVEYIVTEINRDREESREEALAEVERLATPQGRLRDIWALDPEELAANELIDTIINAGRYTRDPDLSPEELRAMLLNLGVPENAADPESFLSIQARALRHAELLRQQSAQHAYLQAEGQKIDAGEIASNWRKVQWARAMSQPAIAVLRPIEWWTDTVNKPFASTVVQPVRAFENLIGQWNFNLYNLYTDLVPDNLVTQNVYPGSRLPPPTRGPGDLEFEVQKARDAGFSDWEAQRIGWDNWETNFFLKLGLEIVIDPLNIIGVGLLTKVTKGIPYLGRAVGATELAINQVAELPFRGMKYLWAGDVSGRLTGRSSLRIFQEQVGENLVHDAGFQGFASRLLTQKGDKIARESIQRFVTLSETAYNKTIGFISPREHRDLVEVITDAAIKNPTAMDESTQVGKLLLGYKLINRDEALNLASRLAGVQDDIGVHADRGSRSFGNFMEELNRLGEDTASLGLGSNKFYGSTNETTEGILRLYGARVTDDNRAVIREWLNSIREGVRVNIRSTFAIDKSVFQQLTDAHRNIRNSFETAARDEINVTRYKQGLVSGLIGDLPEPLRLSWMSTVDRVFTQPLARTYLLFAFYPIYNILEASVKMTLAGTNPFKMGNPYYRNQQRFFGIDNVIPLRYRLPEENFDINIGSYGTDRDEAFELRDILVDPSARLPGFQPTPRTGILGRGQNLLSDVDPRNSWYKLVRAYNNRQTLHHLGNVIQNTVGFNQGKRVVNAQNASLFGQLYDKSLRRNAPEVWEYSHKAVEDAAEGAGLSKLVADSALREDVAESMRESVFYAMMSGDAALVRQTPKTYPLSNVPTGEAELIVREFTELPQTILAHGLRVVRDESIYTQAGVDAARRDMYEIVDHTVMTSSDVFVNNFERMAADMLNTPATDIGQAAAKVHMFNDGLSAFRGSLSNTTRGTIEYADKLSSVVARSRFYTEVWNNSISPNITRFSDLVDRLSANMTEELRQIARATDDPIEKASAEGYAALVGQLTKYNVTWRTVAQNDIAIRAKYTSPSGSDYVAPRDRRDDFWTRFIGEVRRNWEEGREEIIRVDTEVLRAKYAVTGADIPIIPDTSRSGAINTYDVARLFGTLSDDIERNLYQVELKAMKTKPEFVAEVMNQATIASEKYGANLDDLGWTPARVESVYDHLMIKMTGNPDDVPAALALKQQVDSMMSELQSMAINRGAMVNPQAEAAYQSFADKIANVMTKPTIRSINPRPTPAETLADNEATRFRELAYEHFDQLKQTNNVDLELVLSIRSATINDIGELSFTEESIENIDRLVGLLEQFNLRHGPRYEAALRQEVEESARQQLLREDGEVNAFDLREMVSDRLDNVQTLDEFLEEVREELISPEILDFDTVIPRLRAIQRRIIEDSNLGVTQTREDVRQILSQIRRVPDRESPPGAVRAFSGIRLHDDINYPLIPNTTEELGEEFTGQPVIVLHQDHRDAMIQSMGPGGVETFPDQVPGNIFDVDLDASKIQIREGMYIVTDPSAIRVQGISAPGNYISESDPVFPYTGTVREGELIPDPLPVDTTDPLEVVPTIPDEQALVPVSDFDQQEANRLIGGINEYYAGIAARRETFLEQYTSLQERVQRLGARQNRSIATAEKIAEEFIDLVRSNRSPSPNSFLAGVETSGERALNEAILAYKDAPARISARVPVIENGVERLRTRTIRNPELSELWDNILQQLNTFSTTTQAFAPKDPIININQVMELVGTVRNVPRREAPEGTLRVFHGTGAAQNFKQLIMRVPEAETGSPRAILSTYVSDDPSYAMIYTRRTDLGDTRDHMVVSVPELREAISDTPGDARSLGVLYDIDMDLSNAHTVYSDPFGNASSEFAEEINAGLARGATVFEFASTDPVEYMVVNPQALNIRGKVTTQGYHPISDVREHLDLPGLRNPEEQRLFEAVGERPSLDADQTTVAAHDRLLSEGYQQTRADAAGQANLQAVQENPDYDNTTAFGHTMKHIFPFWNYEAHRWAWWLPREMLRHPGTAAAWGKYQNSTDRGYIDVPGPLDADLTRGTIVGGAKRLLTRDYPEYHDRYPKIAEALDYMGRYGFYPGSPVGLFMALYGAQAGTPQLGELVPPLGRTLMGSLAAVAPDSPAAEVINETIFPDRFRNYYIAHQVSTDSINAALGDYDLDNLLTKQREGTLTAAEQTALDAAGTSINGADVLLKMLENIALTPEEEAAWRRGTRGVGKWQPLMEQTGIFRLNPDERRVIRDHAQQLTEEITGVPRSVLEDMRRYGIRYEDVWGARSPELKTALNNLELYSHYSASTSLLPSQLSLAYTRNRHFWNTIQTRNLRFREGLQTVESRVASGEESIEYWETKMQEKVNRLTHAIEDLKETPVYRDVPVTFDERVAFADRTGIKIAFHALEELRALYYGIQLQEVYDEELGRTALDFDRFFTERTAVRSALTPEQFSQFENFINKNDTPLERLRYETWNRFIRPYNAVRDIALARFDEEQQSVIRRSFEAVGTERTELLSQRDESGQQVVAEFNAVASQIRESLRRSDPQLEAWLLFWRRIDQVSTPQAQAIYDELVNQAQRERGYGGILRDVLSVPIPATNPLTTDDTP